MKNCFRRGHCLRLLTALGVAFSNNIQILGAGADRPDIQRPGVAPLPWSQIGATAGADYQGDGLSVTAAGKGARLRCGFQLLQGEATTEGLWLVSTVTPPGGTAHDRFRVVASSVGRVTPCAPQLGARFVNGAQGVTRPTTLLPPTGTVEVAGKLVRFLRPGLTEEYSVSVDGVRQDFLIEKRPAGSGELRLTLAVDGARVEAAACGAQLVLEKSGRKLTYSRLRATDATGRELPARMEIGSAISSINSQPSTINVFVNDTDATYPIRIDPTFSDANWISMGGFPGANDTVVAAVADGSGNIYIGGTFTIAGGVVANHVAKWDGSTWSALGSGMRGYVGPPFEEGVGVSALAVSGKALYAGGWFTNAGGSAANSIAKWDGTTWSALGSGVDGNVYALAASGSNIYAGGILHAAGGSPANSIAKWDGSRWSALGSGIGGNVAGVYALAESGGDLYAAGQFTTAGGSPANNTAKWDGNSWTALGSGINGPVIALAMLGGNLYVGGSFTTAGGNSVNDMAKWDGTSWSALGWGMDSAVWALAMSGTNLYAGGDFTTAGASVASRIAKWTEAVGAQSARGWTVLCWH